MARAKSNRLTLEQLRTDIKKLGAEEGLGRGAQIKFHLRLVEASYQGVIDDVEDKHGAEGNDADVLVKEYYTARAGEEELVWDPMAPHLRKARSVALRCIKLGKYEAAGQPDEPWATVQSLMALRKEVRSANPKNTVDPTSALVRYARAQLKPDTPLIPKELLSQFWLKKQRDEVKRDAEFYIRSIQKLATKLKGEGLEGVKDNSPYVNMIAMNASQWLETHGKGTATGNGEAPKTKRGRRKKEKASEVLVPIQPAA